MTMYIFGRIEAKINSLIEADSVLATVTVVSMVMVTFYIMGGQLF